MVKYKNGAQNLTHNLLMIGKVFFMSHGFTVYVFNT